MKNCLNPQIYENVRPHSSNSVENSQSSRENTTPFSSTSPLASYKEVPPPPPTSGTTQIWVVTCYQHEFLCLSLTLHSTGKQWWHCKMSADFRLFLTMSHRACVLFFTVNSSFRCNLLLYNISFVFPKLCVKNAM